MVEEKIYTSDLGKIEIRVWHYLRLHLKLGNLMLVDPILKSLLLICAFQMDIVEVRSNLVN